MAENIPTEAVVAGVAATAGALVTWVISTFQMVKKSEMRDMAAPITALLAKMEGRVTDLERRDTVSHAELDRRMDAVTGDLKSLSAEMRVMMQAQAETRATMQAIFTDVAHIKTMMGTQNR